MTLHPSTFEYLQPTKSQMVDMEKVRSAFTDLAILLEAMLPDGPDKTYVMRKLRECAMWSTVTITRVTEGGPRE